MKSNYSLPQRPARANSRRVSSSAFFAVLLALSTAAIPTRAATAPPATLVYTAPDNAAIRGGVATIGTSGVTYFSILSTGTTRAKVIKLSATGTPLWTFAPGDGTTYDNLVSVAFVYSPDFGGVITELNSYPLDGGQTPAGLGWTLTSAGSINDFGVIVGYGTNSAGNGTCWIIYPKCQD